MAYDKDPAEKKDYRVDWTKRLAVDSDTIASSAWAVATGLTESVTPPASNTTTTATVWLEGGTAGVAYKVTNTITTADGRIHERSFTINVTDL